MPYAKNTIKVKVPYKSGFDKSHRNSGTLLCGTITPILCDEVIPNSRVSLKLNMAAQLPPLVSDTYMNCKLKTEAFFCPSRLLCGSFESFFSDVPERINGGSTSSVAFVDVKGRIPTITMDNTVSSTVYAPGSLLDYLGFKVGSWITPSAGETPTFTFNPLPLAAYHLIWQEWYRNPRVQNPAFVKTIASATSTSVSTRRVSSMPYNFYHDAYSYGTSSPVSVASNVDSALNSGNLNGYNLADGVSLFALRQRNFGLDYFTGARLSAQQGSASAVAITDSLPSGVDHSGESGFTIAALRAANSLQQFRERNNLPSSRMVDQVRARYNADLSDGVAQRPICIGTASYDISSRGIDQTADSAGSQPNLFSGVGAQYGRAYSAGSDFIISDFTANEPGYIIVNVTLVPEVTYSTGIEPYLTRYTTAGSITDMACSLLQNVGDEPIPISTLSNKLGASWNFGFQDRYGTWMYKPNSAHGRFREGESLANFVLQRSYDGTEGELSDIFLEIPTTYLDGVTAVSSATSGVSAWYDCMLEYHVSMPLGEFSIPSLQDPAYEHGDTVSIRRNGQIF